MELTKEELINFGQRLIKEWGIALPSDILKCAAQEHIEQLQDSPSNTDRIPEWLTPDIIELSKNTWNEHVDINDNKRIAAIKIIKNAAYDAGYTIGIKKSIEIFNEFVLK